MAGLNAEGVDKTFSGLKVLDGAWIAAPEQAITGLIGPNGAGKSTFLTVLSGFALPDAGRIQARGADVTRAAPEVRAGLGVVRTFQVPREFGGLSVLENMIVGARGQIGESLALALLAPRRVRAQERAIIARADALLEFLGLAHLRAARASGLSGGQKKLLDLGRALMGEPWLLLLDEPFAGVAPGLVDVLVEKIHALRAAGHGFLIVEHNMEAVNALCSRVFVMDRGRILMDGTPAAVAADPRVLEAYLGGPDSGLAA